MYWLLYLLLYSQAAATATATAITPAAQPLQEAASPHSGDTHEVSLTHASHLPTTSRCDATGRRHGYDGKPNRRTPTYYTS